MTAEKNIKQVTIKTLHLIVFSGFLRLNIMFKINYGIDYTWHPVFLLRRFIRPFPTAKLEYHPFRLSATAY
jgi:hypothetical protein